MTKTIKDILDTDNLNIRGTVLFAGHASHSVPCSYSLAVLMKFRIVSFFFQNYEMQFLTMMNLEKTGMSYI